MTTTTLPGPVRDRQPAAPKWRPPHTNWTKPRGQDNGTPNWIRKAVEKSAGQGALRKVDLWSNMIWIEKQKLLSRRIVDIGPGPAKDTSAFYQMERNRTAGYWRYVEEHRG